MISLQHDFPGILSDVFNAELFDTGFDKKGRPVESVAEAEMKGGSIPEEKWISLLEPNNPKDDVYVTSNQSLWMLMMEGRE